MSYPRMALTWQSQSRASLVGGFGLAIICTESAKLRPSTHWISRFGPRRKRPVTPGPRETSQIKLLPSLAVTCTSNP